MAIVAIMNLAYGGKWAWHTQRLFFELFSKVKNGTVYDNKSSCVNVVVFMNGQYNSIQNVSFSWKFHTNGPISCVKMMSYFLTRSNTVKSRHAKQNSIGSMNIHVIHGLCHSVQMYWVRTSISPHNFNSHILWSQWLGHYPSIYVGLLCLEILSLVKNLNQALGASCKLFLSEQDTGLCKMVSYEVLKVMFRHVKQKKELSLTLTSIILVSYYRWPWHTQQLSLRNWLYIQRGTKPCVQAESDADLCARPWIFCKFCVESKHMKFSVVRKERQDWNAVTTMPTQLNV